MVTPREAYERYFRATREAESELQCYMHAMTSAADVMDRIQMMILWRSFIEGCPTSAQTMAMMMESTNI